MSRHAGVSLIGEDFLISHGKSQPYYGNDFIIKNNIKNYLLTSGKQKFFQNLNF